MFVVVVVVLFFLSFQLHPRNDQAHTLNRLKREEHGLSIFLPFQDPWPETRDIFPVSSLHELSLWHGFENNSATRYMLT